MGGDLAQRQPFEALAGQDHANGIEQCSAGGFGTGATNDLLAA